MSERTIDRSVVEAAAGKLAVAVNEFAEVIGIPTPGTCAIITDPTDGGGYSGVFRLSLPPDNEPVEKKEEKRDEKE